MTDLEKILGFLGPPGTFSHETALKYSAGQAFYLKPFPTVEQVFMAVNSRETDEGLVPVENSLEGSLNLTFDLLAARTAVKIKGELLCKVEHCLLARAGQKLDQIEEIYSHPQALAQCRRYLEQNLPTATCSGMSSTAEAASMVTRSNGKAVIASRRAAVFYGLEILRENIQDGPGLNQTRFLLLAMEDPPATGRDKTSLLLYLPDRPGSLYSALGLFARYNLNLSKIESRPLRGNLGKYLFFLDVSGHHTDPRLTRALLEAKGKNIDVKVLGSYPCARGCL